MNLYAKYLLSTLLSLGSASAMSMTTLTYDWTEITCGIVTPGGLTTALPCPTNNPSFTARVQPGESVVVTATLSYHYQDDGLALGRVEGFQMDAFGFQMAYFDHEAAGLGFFSSTCRSRYCNPFPHWTDSVSGPIAVVIGNNDAPDDLTGSISFSVAAGISSSWVGPDTRTAYVSVWSREFSPVNAVPEPSTYALMLAGLLSVGFVARHRSRPKTLRA